MNRLTLFLALSLAACGGTPEPAKEAPASAEMPHDGAIKHDGDAMPADGHMKDDAMPHDGDAKPMYACPMHPDVTAHEPGDCSKCGMALVEQEAHDHASHDHGEGDDGH
ncbi:MAG: hypothetical protein H6738_02745 [Alphaproteobacteria bacterium]|nr:hypothetical protein [Alphaproteobacteria bacterium]MCB9695688.1 hypothetical protein [Alphaproteobacteria bacterium]